MYVGFELLSFIGGGPKFNELIEMLRSNGGKETDKVSKISQKNKIVNSALRAIYYFPQGFTRVTCCETLTNLRVSYQINQDFTSNEISEIFKFDKWSSN